MPESSMNVTSGYERLEILFLISKRLQILFLEQFCMLVIYIRQAGRNFDLSGS
jgi:hypothetical protein